MTYKLQDKLVTGLDVMHSMAKYASEHTFIIAGGAVRDQLLSKEINDIDIYTNLKIQRSDYKDALISFLKRKYHKVEVGTLLKNQYTNMYVLPIDIDGVNIEIINYQVITLGSAGPNNFAENLLKTFDIGLCKAAINNDEELLLQEEFHKDMKNKTLTLYPKLLNASQIMRSVTYHIPKLTKKFPEYTPTIDYKG